MDSTSIYELAAVLFGIVVAIFVIAVIAGWGFSIGKFLYTKHLIKLFRHNRGKDHG